MKNIKAILSILLLSFFYTGISQNIYLENFVGNEQPLQNQNISIGSGGKKVKGARTFYYGVKLSYIKNNFSIKLAMFRKNKTYDFRGMSGNKFVFGAEKPVVVSKYLTSNLSLGYCMHRRKKFSIRPNLVFSYNININNDVQSLFYSKNKYIKYFSELGIEVDFEFQLSNKTKMFIAPVYYYNFTKPKEGILSHSGSSVGLQIGLKFLLK